MDRLSVFWVLIAASALLFLAGLWVNVSIWLAGTVEGAIGAGKWRKLLQVGRVAARTLFSRRGGRAIRALVIDGHLHPRLLSESAYRWIAHSSFSLAFFAMFLLSFFTGFVDIVLHAFLGLGSPAVLWVIDKDTLVMAGLNEALGLLLVVGLVMLLVRRYLFRPQQLRTTPVDTGTLVLLGLGLVTAYPLEALRFLAEGAPASGAWASFIGYPLALLLRPLAWPWAALHDWVFFAHVLPFMALLVYTPFSKLFHALVSPFVVMAGKLGEGETR